MTEQFKSWEITRATKKGEAYLHLKYYPYGSPTSKSGKAYGWFTDRTEKGHQRKYRFEAFFDEEGRLSPNDVTVSACDADKTGSFSDRDGPRGAIRELSGLPEGSRPDLKTKAFNCAKEVRDAYFNQLSARGLLVRSDS